MQSVRAELFRSHQEGQDTDKAVKDTNCQKHILWGRRSASRHLQAGGDEGILITSSLPADQ